MSKFIKAAEIKEMMSAQDIKSLAERIVGERPNQARSSQTHLRFGRQGGLAVALNGSDRGTFFDHEHEEGGDLFDLYTHIRGGDFNTALAWIMDQMGIQGAAIRQDDEVWRKRREQAEKERQREAEAEARRVAQRKQKVRNIRSRESGRIAGTPAEAYLRGRGITCALPPCAKHRVIRSGDDRAETAAFERLPEGAEIHQVVFRAEDADRQISAVQTVSTWQGGKLKLRHDPDDPESDELPAKRSRGIAKGAAVKLARTPKDGRIVLAEGPETGLSVYQATDESVWIVLGTSNYASAPIPEEVHEVVIAADLDGGGLAAAINAASYWQTQGKQVSIMLPLTTDLKSDFNDVLQTDGEAAIREAFEMRVSAPAAPESGKRLAVTDPMDALVLWRTTGLPTAVYPKGIKPHTHLTGGEVYAFGASDLPLELADWTPEPGQRVHVIERPRIPVAEAARRGGAPAVQALIDGMREVEAPALAQERRATQTTPARPGRQPEPESAPDYGSAITAGMM